MLWISVVTQISHGDQLCDDIEASTIFLPQASVSLNTALIASPSIIVSYFLRIRVQVKQTRLPGHPELLYLQFAQRSSYKNVSPAYRLLKCFYLELIYPTF